MNFDSRDEGGPSRLRARFRAATRVAIIESAESAFAQSGVKAARMETIAQGAGVAVGTLYNHFDDRRALRDEVMRTRQAELLRHLDEELEAHQRQSFMEQLCTFVEATLDYFSQHPAFLKVLLESEHQLLESVLEPVELSVELRRRVEVLVQRGLKSKALRADGAGMFSWLFLGALHAALVRFSRGEAKESVEAQRAVIVRFILQGAEARR